jgi:hypothetical protein
VPIACDRRSILRAATGIAALFGVAASPFAPQSGTRSQDSSLPHRARAPIARDTRGKILYIDEDGTERGREWFSFTFHKDGQVTLRAYCEIDDQQVERDVVQSMTPKFAPLDCFNRLHVRGEFLGTGWMRITETEAECEVFNVQMGRIHQVVPLPVPATSLVSHPLSADSLLMANFDHSKPERIQSWGGGLATSPLLDGASGPLLAVEGRRSVEYVGPERVTVPAGTFDTDHYRLPMSPKPDGTPRSYDIWATRPDFIFVRGEVRGYLSNRTGFGRYELAAFES